jgi:serine/threonine protein phosphatase 1
MAGRTFAIGDIHGDLEQLRALLAKLPPLGADDTLVFVGDYLDRGPASAEIVQTVRGLAADAGCKVVALRGNHEDAWLRVIDRGWPEFLLPAPNGCLATLRSYTGGEPVLEGEMPSAEEFGLMLDGRFFPEDVVAWMRALPVWYEDEHAIYVHAGVPELDGRWLHPSEVEDPAVLMWTRAEAMFREYRGKTLVIGHTATAYLPPELSHYTPADPADLWAGEAIVAIDTGCGNGGFLTAVELPARLVYESRDPSGL